MTFGDHFNSLPLERLIGGPLRAVVEAQAKTVKTSAEFIQTVGRDCKPTYASPITIEVKEKLPPED